MLVVKAPTWRCPKGHNTLYRGSDAAGFYWSCRTCGSTDNGLNGAEPYQIVTKGQKGQERLHVSHRGEDNEMEAEMEKFRQLLLRLRRYHGTNRRKNIGW